MTVAVDLFAGPGGWDLAAHDLGLDPLGIEYDADVCATRVAAGLRTLQADVAVLDPADFPCDLLIGSPPCQAFSAGGSGEGRKDAPLILSAIEALAAGLPGRAQELTSACTDPRAALVIEPFRFALASRPRWIALEQVPPVLPLWERIAHDLTSLGYGVWAGILSAERYGVPQTRNRAFLIADRERSAVHPPSPTHQAYDARAEASEVLTLDGALAPWVSMADALGWGMTDRPYPVIACSSTTGGPDKEKVGGSAARAKLYAEKAAGRWLNPGSAAHRAGRPQDHPAPTIAFGNDSAAWRWEKTPTARGETGQASDDGSIRLALHEAAVLQGFPADYPWQGNKSSQFRQVGNAVPPPLARAVLAALLHADA